jgi:hypothetical protein
MTPTGKLPLEFAPATGSLGTGKALRDGLSVVARIGASIWVANDESLSLERLTLVPGEAPAARHHVSFPLADYLDLPVPPSADPEKPVEADLEGLAFEAGYLWLVGSHSLKRKQPKLKDGVGKAGRQLAKISHDGNRYLLARIPLHEADGAWHPARCHEQRHAARLAGDDRGNALTEALADDEHLAPFLSIPGKDNGFDIEGLAVADSRVFLGLRGPVLRGWAVILELEPQAKAADILRLQTLDAGGRPYLKHFLQLGGLGIRDLCRQDDDLLILAGPTMDLDGPVRVLRWPGGAMRHESGEMVPADRLERLLDIPYGQGEDHAEGMALFSPDGGDTSSLLVVYDAAAGTRKSEGNTVAADVFPLPPPERL